MFKPMMDETRLTLEYAVECYLSIGIYRVINDGKVVDIGIDDIEEGTDMYVQ